MNPVFKGRNPRQVLIAATTFLGGLYFFLEYIFPKTVTIAGQALEIGKFHDQITTGVQVVGCMAVGLGIINILQVHGHKIIKMRAGWINSLALILGMSITIGVELVDLIDAQQSALRRREFDTLVTYLKTNAKPDEQGSQSLPTSVISATKERLQELRGSVPQAGDDPSVVVARDTLTSSIDTSIGVLELLEANAPTEQSQEKRLELEQTLLTAAKSAQELAAAEREISPIKKTRELLSRGFVESLGSAMFALLAFYIANAAYRAFRVRSLEAVIMMSAALIVMLGQIPFGPLYISSELPTWRLWLIETISTPAFRAIYFGAAIAGLSMAVRMWLSLERSPLAAESDQIGKGGRKK